MSDLDESAVVWWCSSTDRVILMSLIVMPLGVLLGVPALGKSGLAAGTVGLILVEALVLYVGYGILTRVVSPTIRERLLST